TGLLGSTFGLMISAFMLFSLPLNVIALMHLQGWSWFGALVGAGGEIGRKGVGCGSGAGSCGTLG
ncbi:hypothetical protein, partial [Bradyrhizobium campsiandrae]|uniref:hypothetical protein n=1 Tax=Bradyrhizobium campsiandrae TaxID=1729892 RepID=UPI001AED29F5